MTVKHFSLEDPVVQLLVTLLTLAIWVEIFYATCLPWFNFYLSLILVKIIRSLLRTRPEESTSTLVVAAFSLSTYVASIP